MKKLLLNLAFLITLFSCSSDNTNDIIPKDVQNLSELQQIAKENGFALTQSNKDKNVYKVSSIEELKKVIQDMNSDMKQPKVKTIGEDSNVSNEQAQKMLKYLEEAKKSAITKKNNLVVYSNYDDGEIDPPYKYSTTIYFDNAFPAANVFVTINYNVTSGRLSDAEVVTGSWGLSMGSYQQNNVVGMVQNGIFVFQITGQLSGSVGLGNFSLTRSSEIEISGYFQVQAGGERGRVIEYNKTKKEEEQTY